MAMLHIAVQTALTEAGFEPVKGDPSNRWRWEGAGQHGDTMITVQPVLRGGTEPRVYISTYCQALEPRGVNSVIYAEDDLAEQEDAALVLLFKHLVRAA
ncbi:hypothetical protein ACMX2H_18345 [Arthrobacter sulfonylureivorans]|uniref:hypothetical protein n=1 Tax=Arthrobacter sulfonylureivorans TaxID=2486855 RepID=UPI0039E29860